MNCQTYKSDHVATWLTTLHPCPHLFTLHHKFLLFFYNSIHYCIKSPYLFICLCSSVSNPKLMSAIRAGAMHALRTPLFLQAQYSTWDITGAHKELPEWLMRPWPWEVIMRMERKWPLKAEKQSLSSKVHYVINEWMVAGLRKMRLYS